MATAALYLVIWGLSRMNELAHSEWAGEWAFANGDLGAYLDGARRFLATGSPYLPEQITGYWHLEPHSFINPPSALLLFLPFLAVPSFVWWFIPVVGTAWVILHLKPVPWTWPLIAICLAWPRSQGALLTGNTDMWATFFVALGCLYGWPFVLLVIKPTFAPFGVLGARRRSTWIAAALVALAMLPLLNLWIDYISVIRNTDVGLRYSVLNLPLVAIPVIAQMGRATGTLPGARLT
jgi:hypothetical protein